MSPPRSDPSGITRREALGWGSAAAAALVLGLDGVRAPSESEGALDPAAFTPSGWIRIERDGRVVLTIGRSEMGQGVRTALAMILAEELEADWRRIAVVQAAPGPGFQNLGTFGSRSVRQLWMPLRQAGAAAREMLRASAASQWSVPVETCQARSGAVVHAPTGRRLPYGSLVSLAARRPVPRDPPLKQPSAFSRVGRPTRRVDAPDIVTGRARYCSDVRVPGMRRAVVIRCPIFGGTLRRWDAARAERIAGVRVVPLPSGLAVVGPDTWSVLRAREQVEVEWDPGPHARFDSGRHWALLEEAARMPGVVARETPGFAAAEARSPEHLSAEYRLPFQAHAALEPLNALAHVRGDRCEIWAGTQDPNEVQRQVAELLRVPPEQVQVHVTLMGGGFGRRGSPDFVLEAVEASRVVGAPVQVLWTRQDDTQHDRYHPSNLHLVSAGLDPASGLTTWSHTVVGPARGPTLTHQVNGAHDPPYRFPEFRVTFREAPTHVPLGAWRGIQMVNNLGVRECFLDEVAHRLGKDPCRFRLELLAGAPEVEGGREGAKVRPQRLAAVLQHAATRAGWGTPLPPGHGRGISAGVYDGFTYVAEVAEVSILPSEGLRIRRVVCAVDCGRVVNPLSVEGQVEGSVIWALSALRSQITLRDGQVEQSTYGDFPVARLSHTPVIETHLIPSEEPPVGIGEPVVPLLMPAVLNAIFSATGQRIRRLPLPDRWT